MAELLSLWLIGAVFTLCSCGQFGQAAVQFNFSRSTVTVSENGNLPSELSIIKTGENEMDISFRVIVNPGTAQETTDYVANDNDPYVFTSTTRQLPIRTTLMTDRAGESVEQFTICLPDHTVLSSMGAEAVEPTCATIKIIDDDSVVIGFADTSLTLMEGGPVQLVCAEVKDLGLGLDPFDRVPLNINANNGGTVQLSGSSILFEMGRRTACVDISAVDNNIADGNHSVSLVITSGGTSSVPVELYPNILPVNITDNDLVTFTFVPQMLPVLEGRRNVSIKIRRSRDTTFAFRVMLSVDPLANSASSDLRINQTVLLINPLTMESGFEIDISDNIPKMAREFNISLSQIEAINGTGALISKGEPIKITVFDKDFEVGFTNKKISLAEDSEGVCVAILSPAEVHPSVNIGVSVTVENLTFAEGNLELGTNTVVLSATNPRECIVVKFPIDNQQCDIDKREYALQLSSITDTNSRYSVNIRQENITISISDSQDCLRQSNVAGIVAGVVVGVSVVVIIIVSSIVIYFVWLKKCISSVTGPGVEYETTYDEVVLSNSPSYECMDDLVDQQRTTHIPTGMSSTNGLGVRPEQREDHTNNSHDSTELITRDNSSIINIINIGDNNEGRRNGGDTNDSEDAKRNSDGGHTNDSDGTKRSSDGSHTNDSDGTKRSSNGGHTDDSEGDRRSSDGGHIDDSEGTKQSSDINEGRQQSSDGSFTTEGREQSNNRGDTDQGAELNNDCDTQKVV